MTLNKHFNPRLCHGYYPQIKRILKQILLSNRKRVLVKSKIRKYSLLINKVHKKIKIFNIKMKATLYSFRVTQHPEYQNKTFLRMIMKILDSSSIKTLKYRIKKLMLKSLLALRKSRQKVYLVMLCKFRTPMRLIGRSRSCVGQVTIHFLLEVNTTYQTSLMLILLSMLQLQILRIKAYFLV